MDAVLIGTLQRRKLNGVATWDAVMKVVTGPHPPIILFTFSPVYAHGLFPGHRKDLGDV